MNTKLIITAILITTLAAACGSANTPTLEPTPDIAAVRTSAASTVVSQFTLTAAAFTPTPQPEPPTQTSAPVAEASPTATTVVVAQVTNAQGTSQALCDSLSIDPATVDVNVPDGTTMSPGQDFVKTWRVKNNGGCPWGAGYKLVYAGYSNDMDGQFQPMTQVIQPGEEVELSVQFKAPSATGEYLSAWQMQNPKGVTFPEIIFVKIVVQ